MTRQTDDPVFDPGDEDTDPDSFLAYATPRELRLMRLALLRSATRAQTDLPCQAHSERYGRNRVIELMCDMADQYEARAKTREEGTETPTGAA